MLARDGETLPTISSGDPLPLAVLPDALGDALGIVIADLRREWEREIERISAEARAVVAEFRAENAKLAAENGELRGQLKDRIDGEVGRLNAAMALVKNGEPGKDADPQEIARQINEAVEKRVAEIPPPEPGPPGQSVTLDDVRPLVLEAVAALPPAEPGAPGKDADPEAIRAMVAAEVEEAVKSLPMPQDGHTPTAEELAALVETALSAAMEALPVPKDGKSVDPAEVELMVAEAVAKLPPAEPGKSIDAEEVKRTIADLVERAVVDIPKPQGIDPADVAQMVVGEVQKAVTALPAPKDGVGLAGAVIDRDGGLAITLTDGTIRTLGQVVGKSADQAEIVRLISEEVAKFPPPKDGKDGVGFDDLTAEYDGERAVVLRFVRGENTKEFTLKLPIPIDRGIWRDGQQCEAADVVGFGGSAWIAVRDTAEKPDMGAKDWRLLVKKGRDGKDGTVRHVGPPEPVKLR